MLTLPESTSSLLSRKLATAVALVGFGVLSLTTLAQRRVVDRLEQRVAVLEQQNLRLTTSVQALEAQASEAQDQDDVDAPDTADDDMEDLVTTARELYVRGEYEVAAAVVEPATRVEATADRAWRIIGASSCFEHDGRNAKRASERLDENGRQFVAYVCARNDIKL
jgi:hypothetical protein